MAVDLSASLFASTGILLILALVTTVLRCITRFFIVRSSGMDDWLMIVTMILFTHYCSWVFYGRSLDLGRPTDEIPLSQISPALMSFWIAENTYILTACTLKLSIGTFLLRIVQSRVQMYLIYTMLSVVSLYSTFLLLLAIFQCTPIDHFWKPTSPGHCVAKEVTLNTSYAQSAVIAVSDFFFAIFPTFVVWHLQLDRFTKISVCGFMGFGAIAGITTIARVPYIKALVDNSDFFESTTRIAILSAVEPGIGIILGSAAATRPLFRSIITKLRTYHSEHRTHTAHSRIPSENLQLSGNVKTTFSTICTRHSTSHDIEMGNFDVSSDNSNIVTATTMKGFCSNCGSSSDHNTPRHSCNCELKENVGDLRSGSQVALSDTYDGGIYKEVEIKRIVEFVKRKH